MSASGFPLQLSLFFFGADSGDCNNYQLLRETSSYADRNGFTAAWVPERHFMRFGGLYGSPTITGAALAVTTKQLKIRAGSVVFPLANPLRVAEEWSMIDNLSNGRVALGAASGWHVNDFVLDPPAWHRRREVLSERIDIVRRLWRGEAIEFPNGEGQLTPVRILPKPIQPEVEMWLTVGKEEGFRAAASLGFNVLTSNFALQYKGDELARCIGVYRDQMLREHGRPGHVTLMVHTYAGETAADVDATATPAMMQYMEINLQLVGTSGPEHNAKLGQLEGRRREILLAVSAREKMTSELSFIGTTDELVRKGRHLKELGVDELACLSDFGVPFEPTMRSMHRLAAMLG